MHLQKIENSAAQEFGPFRLICRDILEKWTSVRFSIFSIFTLLNFRVLKHVSDLLSSWMFKKPQLTLAGEVQPHFIFLDVVDVDALLKDAQFCILTLKNV